MEEKGHQKIVMAQMTSSSAFFEMQILWDLELTHALLVQSPLHQVDGIRSPRSVAHCMLGLEPNKRSASSIVC